MSDELTQLRAMLKKLDEYPGMSPVVHAKACIQQDIAKLEKAEADPWADEKHAVQMIEAGSYVTLKYQQHLARYVRHLEAENVKQAARIAELEARPIPPLDPKRVIATACKVFSRQQPEIAGFLMQHMKSGNAGIYPLAGDDE